MKGYNIKFNLIRLTYVIICVVIFYILFYYMDTVFASAQFSPTQNNYITMEIYPDTNILDSKNKEIPPIGITELNETSATTKDGNVSFGVKTINEDFMECSGISVVSGNKINDYAPDSSAKVEAIVGGIDIPLGSEFEIDFYITADEHIFLTVTVVGRIDDEFLVKNSLSPTVFLPDISKIVDSEKLFHHDKGLYLLFFDDNIEINESLKKQFDNIGFIYSDDKVIFDEIHDNIRLYISLTIPPICIFLILLIVLDFKFEQRYLKKQTSSAAKIKLINVFINNLIIIAISMIIFFILPKTIGTIFALLSAILLAAISLLNCVFTKEKQND